MSKFVTISVTVNVKCCVEFLSVSVSSIFSQSVFELNFREGICSDAEKRLDFEGVFPK